MRGRVETAPAPGVTPAESARAARRISRLGAASRSLALGTLSVGVLIAVWYAVTARGYISPIFLPSPPQVMTQARRYLTDGSLFWHVLTSGRRVLGGFLLRSEEHTSELQSLRHLVCRLLLEKKKD